MELYISLSRVWLQVVFYSTPIWHFPFGLFAFLILLYMLFLPAFFYIHSPPPFSILQHIYSVVLCCVSEDKAGVLMYDESYIQVNEMVRSTKGSMFITVFINIRSYVPGKKGGGANGYFCEWITSFKKLNFLCSCESLPGVLDLYADEHLLIALPFLLVNSLLVPWWRERHLNDNMNEVLKYKIFLLLYKDYIVHLL